MRGALLVDTGPIVALLNRRDSFHSPMDLADACLVRMAERATGNTLLTLDSDFNIYRIHGRQAIPTILPSSP